MNRTSPLAQPPKHQSRIFGSVGGRVRKLSGFQKSHHIPDGQHAAAQAFVRKIGQQLVKTTLDELHADIRSLFGYKRKDFDYSCEDGFGCLKTPDFDLQVSIDQCPHQAANYILTTEISTLHNSEIVVQPNFHTCFTHHCEILIVELTQAIDLNEKIDAIEAMPEIAECLNYKPDCSAFELKLPALDLHIHFTECEVTFQLLTLRDLGKLLDHSRQAFDILAQAESSS